MRIKISGVESLALNRIFYIAPRREKSCSKRPDQATLLIRRGGARNALFRVLAWKSCAPENQGASPNQPPSTTTQPSDHNRYDVNHHAPATNIAPFNDKVSRNTARRQRQLLVGAGGIARPGGIYETDHSKRASHKTSDLRRKHTNEISGPVLLKHDTNDFPGPSDHEFTTLIIARSMLSCTIGFS